MSSSSVQSLAIIHTTSSLSTNQKRVSPIHPEVSKCVDFELKLCLNVVGGISMLLWWVFKVLGNEYTVNSVTLKVVLPGLETKI